MSSEKGPMSRELQWGAGCLVGGAAFVGLVILLMYVAFALDLSVWAQTALGIGIVLGGGLLVWLVVVALGQPRPGDRGRGGHDDAGRDDAVVEPLRRPEEPD